MSSFTLFASYLFVFVCMRLGMIRLFIDVCVAVKPKMHGPSPRHLVHIIACEFKERLFLLRDCVRDCPCSPSLPCNPQRWEICCLKRVQLSLLSSLSPSVHPSCRPFLLTLHSFFIVVLMFALQVKKKQDEDSTVARRAHKTAKQKQISESCSRNMCVQPTTFIMRSGAQTFDLNLLN